MYTNDGHVIWEYAVTPELQNLLTDHGARRHSHNVIIVGPPLIDTQRNN